VSAVRWFKPTLPALLVLIASLPAAADSAQQAADLRCLAVMAKLNQLPEPRHQFGSLIGGYYYLGRINASGALPDLGQSVAEAYAKMPAAEFIAETTRCQTEMKALGSVLSSIGAAMPKANPAPPPGSSQSPPQQGGN
jgi:hypothetical protein